MDKSTVIARLREHEPELKAAGIIHLGLHGSVVRGNVTSCSDVDLIAVLGRQHGTRLGVAVHLNQVLDNRAGLCQR